MPLKGILLVHSDFNVSVWLYETPGGMFAVMSATGAMWNPKLAQEIKDMTSDV